MFFLKILKPILIVCSIYILEFLAFIFFLFINYFLMGEEIKSLKSLIYESFIWCILVRVMYGYAFAFIFGLSFVLLLKRKNAYNPIVISLTGFISLLVVQTFYVYPYFEDFINLYFFFSLVFHLIAPFIIDKLQIVVMGVMSQIRARLKLDV